MAVTIDDVLRSGPEVVLVAGTTDPEVTWVHSSDLFDPSPFLDRGHLLLTTGAQLEGRGPVEVGRYVDRLVGAGVCALGFGTGVGRDDVPPELVTVCTGAGLPLLEVPYATPFIAVARWVAEALAAEANARDAWALRAQRAISLAALSRGRTAAVLTELARQLGGEVILYDSRGEPVARHGTSAGDAGEVGGRRAEMQREAVRLVRRRLRAGSSVERADTRTVLQTLGRRHELRGVLAVTCPERLDGAATAVLTSATALVELALEDVARRRTGERVVRGQLLELLLAGRRDVVAQVVGADRLPVPPLRVLLVDAERALASGVEDGLELGVPAGTPVLAGPHDDGLVMVAADGQLSRLVDVIESAGIAAGVSRRTDYANLTAALVQARSALEQANGSTRTVYADTEGDPMLGIWPRGEIAELSRIRLAAVVADPDGADLLRTLEVWLRHNAAWEPAARELGVHRHTVKAKVRRVETLLDLSLDGFGGKAQLWMMLLAR